MAGILKTVSPYNRGPGHFCVGELNYERANQPVVIALAAPAMLAGQIMGKITASGKYVPLNTGAATGEEVFAGILWDDVADSAADQKKVVTVREATVNSNALVGWSALSAPQKATAITQAAALGIIILT
jgi:hypothetical protein